MLGGGEFPRLQLLDEVQRVGADDVDGVPEHSHGLIFTREMSNFPASGKRSSEYRERAL